MHREESQSDLGIISIHNNVIASVAFIAASEIEGVKRIGSNFKSGLFELLGKESSAIRVFIDKRSQVSLEIPLITKYGYSIPEVSNKAQENIRNAIEKMTNLSVKDINIIIQGVEKGGE